MITRCVDTQVRDFVQDINISKELEPCFHLSKPEEFSEARLSGLKRNAVFYFPEVESRVGRRWYAPIFHECMNSVLPKVKACVVNKFVTVRMALSLTIDFDFDEVMAYIRKSVPSLIVSVGRSSWIVSDVIEFELVFRMPGWVDADHRIHKIPESARSRYADIEIATQ